MHDDDSSEIDPDDAAEVRLASAVERLSIARRFTNQFLADMSPEEWFWSPPQFPTHIAWQVMHIAVAQYSLCFRRIRGELPEDEAWCPPAYRTQFGIGSAPNLDPGANPSIEEIRRVFDGVYAEALNAVPDYDVEHLAGGINPPHPVFMTKLGAIEFAPHHEAVHAGQIAMIRRLMGKAPLR